jgi:hypothetical protein
MLYVEMALDVFMSNSIVEQSIGQIRGLVSEYESDLMAAMEECGRSCELDVCMKEVCHSKGPKLRLHSSILCVVGPGNASEKACRSVQSDLHEGVNFEHYLF